MKITPPDKLGTSLFVRSARNTFGWSQVELAAKAGVSPATIYRLEAGASVRTSTWMKVRDIVLKEMP